MGFNVGWPIIAAGAISAIGALAGGNQARQGAEAQMEAAERAAQAFAGVKIPTIQEQQIILQTPDLMGQYTPEQVEAMQMNVSAMEGVRADQGTIDAQNQALQQFQEIAKGGFTEADKAAARQAERQVSQSAQARQKAILNAMASRGVLGSGMELAAQLQGEQQALDQSAQQSDRLIQEAQARSLQALGQQGQMAGQMRSQQFGEQSDIARARDMINQFNTQNRQNVANTNVGERNRAQQTNLQMQQERENLRSGLANQQQMYNKGLIQQDYQNRLNKASGLAGQFRGAGEAAANLANTQAGQIQGIAGAIGSGLASYAGSQENKYATNRALNSKYGTKYDTGE